MPRRTSLLERIARVVTVRNTPVSVTVGFGEAIRTTEQLHAVQRPVLGS
ncbi:hypothetical protein AB5I39_16800 [Sphingomonas sp. MMS24-J45]